jgi:formate dehydrogenase major subunit
VEVSPALAAERGLAHLDWAHVITARAVIEALVIVTDRLTPLRVEGRLIHQIWLPYHWGTEGLTTGDSANDLVGITLDPNVLIQESKVGTCDIRPGRRPTGRMLLAYLADYRRRAGVAGDHTTGEG